METCHGLNFICAIPSLFVIYFPCWVRTPGKYADDKDRCKVSCLFSIVVPNSLGRMVGPFPNLIRKVFLKRIRMFSLVRS